MAGLYLSRGNVRLYQDIPKALEDFGKGIEVAYKAQKILGEQKLSIRDFSDRVTGPLLVKKGMALLMLDRPDEAELAFTEASGLLTGGLNNMYFGHTNLIRKEYETIFIEYGSLDNLTAGAKAVADLYQFAYNFESDKERFNEIKDSADRLKAVLPGVRPEIDSLDLEYEVEYDMINYFRLSHRYNEAIKWSNRALALVRENMDTSLYRSRDLYEWQNRFINTTLNLSYYTIFQYPKAAAELEIAAKLSDEAIQLHERYYTRSGHLLYTNAGHIALLRGDKAGAMAYYRKYLTRGIYKNGSGEDVLMKDWRDMELAGIVLVGIAEIKKELFDK
jgi:tetratricopeptide (TPR) repeat protein